MACVGELSLDKFKEWLDDIKAEDYDNGYQDGFEEGQANS